MVLFFLTSRKNAAGPKDQAFEASHEEAQVSSGAPRRPGDTHLAVSIRNHWRRLRQSVDRMSGETYLLCFCVLVFLHSNVLLTLVDRFLGEIDGQSNRPYSQVGKSLRRSQDQLLRQKSRAFFWRAFLWRGIPAHLQIFSGAALLPENFVPINVCGVDSFSPN